MPVVELAQKDGPKSEPKGLLEGTSVTLPPLTEANSHLGTESDAYWLPRLGRKLPDDDEPTSTRTPNLRRELYRLADAYREHAVAPRVGKCGHVRHAHSVEISLAGKRAQLGGLIRCRSKACPVCLAHRRADYADQIRMVAELWQGGWQGTCTRPDKTKCCKLTGVKLSIPQPPITELAKHAGTPAYLATFTIRHGWDDDLKTTGHGVRDAWRRMIQSRAWREVCDRFGFEYIVAEEITHGKNGWHPHLHVLFLPRRKIKTDDGLALADWFFEEWSKHVVEMIGPEFRPLRGDDKNPIGTDFRPCTKEDYISKTVGLELADPHNKRGRGGGRTPVQLLQSYADSDDERALNLYQHYERTMRGRRDLTWSQGLRDYRLVAIQELKEAQALEQEAAPLVAELPGDVWDKWRHERTPHVRMLEAAESDGLLGVCALLKDAIGPWAVDIVRQTTERGLREREELHRKRLALKHSKALQERAQPPPLQVADVAALVARLWAPSHFKIHGDSGEKPGYNHGTYPI